MFHACKNSKRRKSKLQEFLNWIFQHLWDSHSWLSGVVTPELILTARSGCPTITAGLPVPKKFELYENRQDNQAQGEIDSPPCPERPSKTLPGDQRKKKHRSFASREEKIL